jgi:hypothetical protein
MLTVAPAGTVSPVLTQELLATLTVKLADTDWGRHPDGPQHFSPDVQQS